jgi:outer membrane protein TolC
MTATAIAAALTLAQAAPAPLLTYDDAIRQALARNLDLQAAQARLDQAKTIGWKAWSAQLPQVAAGATWTHNSASSVVELPVQFAIDGPGATVTGQPTAFAKATVQKVDQVGAQLQATVPLVAPQLWFGISAAQAGQRQAELTVEAARREILFGVAQLYYGAVGGKYAVQITEKQLAIARDHEKDARVRYQAGTTPKVAFLRAEIDRARAES